MTLRVSSTTDTEEEVRRSVGLPPEKTEAELEAEKAKAEAPDSPEAEARGEAAEADKSKKNGGWQKRVDKLTENLHSTRQQLETEREDRRKLEERLSKLEKGTSGEHTAATDPDPKPERANFANDAEFNEPQTRWAARDEGRKEDARRQQADDQARIQRVFDEYQGALPAAKTAHEDFEEVLGKNPNIPRVVQTAIIAMGVDGPELAYALASNPEMCERLVEIMEERGDAAAVVAFGRFAAKVLPEHEPTEEEKAAAEKEKKDAAASPAVRQSKAKAPITPVNSSRVSNQEPLIGMKVQKGGSSLADYRRKRESGMVQ
ncbi:MAG TPA: hypothetical protein VET48_07980 [Steroidobacteraceae bacterium]|nr:hypothetical protein [Steroidobacteraceae bacterium]